MNKKFKFKLESVLKLKKLEEEKIKIELGKINQKCLKIENDIGLAHEAIAKAYDDYEIASQTTQEYQILNFFPNYIASLKKKIIVLKKELALAGDQKEEQIELLKFAMGESKIIEKLKEKKRVEFDKKLLKMENLEREELIIIRRNVHEMGI